MPFDILLAHTIKAPITDQKGWHPYHHHHHQCLHHLASSFLLLFVFSLIIISIILLLKERRRSKNATLLEFVEAARLDVDVDEQAQKVVCELVLRHEQKRSGQDRLYNLGLHAFHSHTQTNNELYQKKAE